MCQVDPGLCMLLFHGSWGLHANNICHVVITSIISGTNCYAAEYSIHVSDIFLKVYNIKSWTGRSREGLGTRLAFPPNWHDPSIVYRVIRLRLAVCWPTFSTVYSATRSSLEVAVAAPWGQLQQQNWIDCRANHNQTVIVFIESLSQNLLGTYYYKAIFWLGDV